MIAFAESLAIQLFCNYFPNNENYTEECLPEDDVLIVGQVIIPELAAVEGRVHLAAGGSG